MISREEIEQKKKQAIDKLKKEIKNSLLENFVEEFGYWQSKMNDVNDLIGNVDSDIPLYGYDEFCKTIIEITKSYLENNPDYDKLFLTSSDYLRLMSESSNDENKTEQAMLKELNKKFMDNFMLILNNTHLKESIRYKLKEKFVSVEEDLDKSLKIAEAILKKYEEKK